MGGGRNNQSGRTRGARGKGVGAASLEPPMSLAAKTLALIHGGPFRAASSRRPLAGTSADCR